MEAKALLLVLLLMEFARWLLLLSALLELLSDRFRLCYVFLASSVVLLLDTDDVMTTSPFC